ncbi:SusD/RagB family nutrient-binding outer membrane lipoprotein [Xanthocytophaga agilis]
MHTQFIKISKIPGMVRVLSVLILSVLTLVSCENGFDQLNINKTNPTAINPVFSLNNAVINSSFNQSSILYEMGIVQQLVTPNSGFVTGANFNQDNRDQTNGNWVKFFQSAIRHTQDVLNQKATLENRPNLIQMARILQAYNFMVLTDTYGDIPYSEAGKGYSELILYPKYDTQQSIYTDIIKELNEASTALDASKPIESADVLYGGNVTQWKKFANSLLLRAGMRLVKADAALAMQTAVKAIEGGLIDANADNAIIRHDANYTNPIGVTLNSTEAANLYLTAPFVNQLKSTNDPRLRAIAVRYVGAKSGPEQKAAIASTDPSVQVGMPMGYDNATIGTKVTELNLASFYDFSQVDRTRMAKILAPTFLVTASQTQLLLAEAVQRGWTTGDVAELYNKGVRLHMEQMALFDANSAVTTQQADAYLNANPFDASKALEQINTQYWISSFLNGPETWANFRRSGFPALTPNPYPGKTIKGNFINRLTYPNSEISVNKTNVDAAISRQGADDLDSKVWWDK